MGRFPPPRARAWIRSRGSALAAAFVAAAAPVLAQDYPQRPIRLIVGFTPGGTTDLVARLIATRLTERFGQQVVIDNRPGASGLIAADIVSKSQPDGYTLLISGASISIAGSLYATTKFDVQRDLDPLALVATTPYVMVAHPSIPVKTIAELVAHARSQPGRISWGASTPGTVQHLSGEMFKRLAGIEMVYIPYKGTGAMMPDVLGGRLQMAIDNVVVMAQHIKLGTLRALAVTTGKRTPILPDVPSLAESGFAGFDASGWFGMYCTPRTPAAVVKKLNGEILSIVSQGDVRERLLGFGATPYPGTPADLRRQLEREVPVWRKVIREAGLKVE